MAKARFFLKGSSMIRAFIAIEIGDEIRKNIHDLQKNFIKLNSDVRWVNPENIHITLKFLGNIDERKLPKISVGLSSSVKGISSFSLSIRNLGAFPSLNRPRVVWVGIDDNKTIQDLYKNIENEMAKIGFKKEKRDFNPHLTIGRVRSMRGIGELISSISENKSNNFGTFLLNSVILFKSTLTPTGSIYTKIKIFELLG